MIFDASRSSLLARHTPPLLLGVCASLLVACSSPQEKALAKLAKLGRNADAAAVEAAVQEGNVAVLQLLQQAGVDITAAAPGKESPLIRAIKAGNAAAPFLATVAAPNHINDADAAGRTALSHAVERKMFPLAAALLERGAKVEKCGHPSPTVIKEALHEKEITLAQRCIADCEIGSPHLAAALPVAVMQDDLDTAALLLAKGVPATSRMEDKTPLLTVACRAGKLEMARLLLNYGATPLPAGQSEDNPLRAAVAAGHDELAEMLLHCGAEPNTVGEGGRSPLAEAILQKNLALAETILRCGGDATPFFNAAFEAGDRTLMDLLTSYGASVNRANAEGDPPLVKAVRQRDEAMVDYLLTKSADPLVVGKEGETAFALALLLEQPSVVEKFLMAGVPADTPFRPNPSEALLEIVSNDYFKRWLRRDQNLTPLMLGAARGDVALCRLLMKYGAKRSVQTKGWKRYPVNFACEQFHIPAAQLLLGRDPDSDRDVRILISLSKQRAYLYRDGKVVRSTSISTGRSGYATPRGRYVISDKQVYWRSTIYHVPMPHFMRLSCRDFGLHEGHVTGRPASHGCIRLPKAEAAAFFAIAKIGDPVTIE